MSIDPQAGMPVPSAFDHLQALDFARFPRGERSRARLSMVENGLGQSILMPVMIARGVEDGPVLGLTAAVHGNELNGIRVIQRLFADLDARKLRGTVLGVPVVNLPGLLMHQREFNDGADLNRIMPGRADGNMSQVYAHRVVDRVVSHLTHLIDLHTASFGRVNSLYVRADLSHPETRWMAFAQQPQIIVNSPSADATLRGAAVARGIPAITVEVGDPQRFQPQLIRYGLVGVSNVLARLGMIDAEERAGPKAPVVCTSSAWVHTSHGGLLEVDVGLEDLVDAGQPVGRVTNVYGDVLATYHAPRRSIVVGRATNPVCQTGARVVHLGDLSDPGADTP